MQDDLNGILDKDWKYKHFDNRLAAIMETAELIDHYPWKWWKQGGEANVGQARMELVDVWHFVLSELLLYPCDSVRQDVYHVDIRPDEMSNGIKDSGRALIGALANGSVPKICDHFHWLRADVGMTWEDLYKLYMGKNLLNKLRWSTGYGTKYIKDWKGVEDNEYLTSVLMYMNADDPLFAEKVSSALATRYAEVVAAAQAA